MSACLSIADENGLDALTVRGVARLCKVTPMAIYRHVDSVQGLEELAFRKALQGMAQPDPSGDWRQQVKSIWGNFRQILQRHPGAAEVFAKRAMPTPEIIQATNQLFEVLETAGHSGNAAFAAYDVTFIFTLGSIRFDLTRAADARRGLAEAPRMATNLEALSRYTDQLSSRDADAKFDAGLDMILRGLSR
ncbi:MAG: hypothetical protein GXP05_05570 [Alphaproteobacteria bacterium]|nr:hypothetical protein [Alphaproteobacteria bacterium]